MKFVLRMMIRETRASWRRLLFFFICIAVGVAAIAALRSVIQSMRQVFGREAKSLIAADVLVSTNREWTEAMKAAIDRRLREHRATEGGAPRPASENRTETVETPTMVRPADSTKRIARMVELRAVQAAFPLYGTMELASRPYSHDLLEYHGALVRPELLVSLGLSVGDRILIGQAAFSIRGVITSEPGRSIGTFSLGPRVMIDLEDLPSTNLLGFGSRARRLILLRVPEDRIQPLVRAIQRDARDLHQGVSVRSYRTSDDQIGRDFERAEDYLSLVGLVIVILGGIAVSSVIRVFVLQKVRSIAVLKCLGSRSRQITAVYLLQVLLLGLGGSVVGLGLARAAIAAVPMALGSSRSILAEAHYGLSASAAVQGVAIGILVSALFSIVPLLQVRLVKPSALLRDEPGPRTQDWTRMAAMAVVLLALLALTAWQAGSARAGTAISIGFAVLAVSLHLTGRGLIKLVAPLAASKSFPVRHAVLHLSRPGNQTRVIMLAVGLGAFFIVGIRSLQANLLGELALRVGEDSADMFLLDVQQDQVGGVRAFLSDPVNSASNSRIIPILRARIVGVIGRQGREESFEDLRPRGSLGRSEYTVTYRDHLEANERVLAGRFWSGPSPDAEVSIERSMHERFAIDVGDAMRFDVLGRSIVARVTSIRDVDWKDARSGGFMIVFRPGVLDRAPHTFVAPLKGPADAAGRARFQHDIVERFPNVSVIDFHEILQTVRAVLSKVTLAITVVGGLVLLSGAMILIGAVAMTRFQRVYESAVFKTLGAGTRTIAKLLVLEYGVLGLLAGAVGSIGAIGLTWGVSRFALEIPWRVFAGEHVAGMIVTGGLVAVVGVLSSLDVLRNRPLATLRAE